MNENIKSIDALDILLVLAISSELFGIISSLFFGNFSSALWGGSALIWTIIAFVSLLNKVIKSYEEAVGLIIEQQELLMKSLDMQVPNKKTKK